MALRWFSGSSPQQSRTGTRGGAPHSPGFNGDIAFSSDRVAPEADTGGCPEMGEDVDVQNASIHRWGDIDCSEVVDPVDALKLLRYDAGLDVARPPDCPDPGEAVAISPAS